MRIQSNPLTNLDSISCHKSEEYPDNLAIINTGGNRVNLIFGYRQDFSLNTRVVKNG